MNDSTYLEAIQTFREKFAKTAELPTREPSAMSLATVDANAQPSIRTVLLRGFDERGFVFYTNSLSRKGQQMMANPKVGLCFFWDAWAEQVHVEGEIQKVDDAESDAYWETRPRLSRIGAWASEQSTELDSHATLLQRVEDLEKKYDGIEVPRPEHWFGFRVVPSRIEFWCGKDARLHERVVYEQSENEWTKRMLYP
jgi:pyridoxamine 5'-phosphate oxidase